MREHTVILLTTGCYVTNSQDKRKSLAEAPSILRISREESLVPDFHSNNDTNTKSADNSLQDRDGPCRHPHGIRRYSGGRT